MNANERHYLFLAVAGGVLAFVVFMRGRLTANYPDDQSKQMQSMLGFLRGLAIFAGIVVVLVLLDLLRITLQ